MIWLGVYELCCAPAFDAFKLKAKSVVHAWGDVVVFYWFVFAFRVLELLFVYSSFDNL
jgi:hypothetical protein